MGFWINSGFKWKVFGKKKKFCTLALPLKGVDNIGKSENICVHKSTWNFNGNFMLNILLSQVCNFPPNIYKDPIYWKMFASQNLIIAFRAPVEMGHIWRAPQQLLWGQCVISRPAGLELRSRRAEQFSSGKGHFKCVLEQCTVVSQQKHKAPRQLLWVPCVMSRPADLWTSL